MMQGNKGPDAALPQALEHLSVAVQSAFVPAPFFRLDLAPFHREPQSVDAQRLRQVKVPFGIAPPVASQACFVARLDASPALPGRPLIVEVSAFHLVGRRSYAPGKTGWKNVVGRSPKSVIHS